MEFINQKAEKLHETGIDLVARAARICYKSEGNKEKNKEFVKGLIKKGHLSPLEFWRLPYLSDNVSLREKNARTIIERWMPNWTYLKEADSEKFDKIFEECCKNTSPNDYNFKCYMGDWIAMEITTNIGIARELMRHRVFSYCQESTRYCNYSKKGLRFIDNGEIPHSWLADVEERYNVLVKDCLINRDYDNATPIKPEIARDILPLCTATTLVMGGFRSDWERMLDLRLNEVTGKVHPQMKELARMIENELYEKN